MNSISNQVALKRRATIEVTGTSETMKPGFTYIANNAALVTLNLPASAQVGDRIRIIGKGAGLFKIGQAAGQQVRHLTSDTTAGAGGSLTAGTARDVIEIECTTAPGIWTSDHVKGTFVVA